MTEEFDEDVLDDDLQDLLNELDEADSTVDQIIEEIDEQEPDEENEEPVASEEDEEVLRPLDVRDLGEVEETTIAPVTESASPSINVMKYHDKLDQVTTEVLAACRADRQEAQDVIDLLRLQIDDAVNKSQSPQRMWVDGLVKAVEVKAGINATAVKIIEANAKMLAATKAGVNILNQNIQTGTEDLEDVLSRPLTDQDEY